MAVNGTTKVNAGEKEIDFKAPYKRVTIYDAIKEHTGIDITELDEDGLRDVCRQLHIHADKTWAKENSLTKYSAAKVNTGLYNRLSSSIIL